MKAEIEETLKLLVQVGICVIATSRPEGVIAEKWADTFVIARLAALSDEQQHAMVVHQLDDDKLFNHLSKFASIRKEHDRIYRKVAIPSAEDRSRLEKFEVPDLQFRG